MSKQKMYELRRWRTRRGLTHNDVGSEHGWFRYDISLGWFDTKEECYRLVSKLTGKLLSDITEEFERHGFYYGDYYPTGYSGQYYEYENPTPEWYNDEYHIVEWR